MRPEVNATSSGTPIRTDRLTMLPLVNLTDEVWDVPLPPYLIAMVIGPGRHSSSLQKELSRISGVRKSQIKVLNCNSGWSFNHKVQYNTTIYQAQQWLKQKIDETQTKPKVNHSFRMTVIHGVSTVFWKNENWLWFDGIVSCCLNDDNRIWLMLQPRTHLTKGLWTHGWNHVKMFSSLILIPMLKSSQFCACHENTAVMWKTGKYLCHYFSPKKYKYILQIWHFELIYPLQNWYTTPYKGPIMWKVCPCHEITIVLQELSNQGFTDSIIYGSELLLNLMPQHNLG